MNSFSTFIRYYILIGLSLIIPFASTIHKNVDNEILKITYVESPIFNIKPPVDSKKPVGIEHTDIEFEVANIEAKSYLFNTAQDDATVIFKKPDFWTTLYSVETKQGKLLYRPSNKNRNCDTTSAPCGHHQLSLQALKDISCFTKQCKRDRENFQKSLAMSKQLQAINDKRLKKAGYTDLPEYQRYLIHQQGASGLKKIIASSKGSKLLSRNLKKNMAGNSPYSYRTLRKMGSKLAAKKFLQHWEEKWQKEKVLIGDVQGKLESVATVVKPRNTMKLARVVKPVSKKSKTKARKKLDINTSMAKITSFKEDSTIIVPLFNNYELQIALNIKI
ncbi:MAG: hypothetical protein L3J51_00465 [Cocleimonas sp.]|nr:hypothetical protein [Cocleimonas sp.]